MARLIEDFNYKSKLQFYFILIFPFTSYELLNGLARLDNGAAGGELLPLQLPFLIELAVLFH